MEASVFEGRTDVYGGLTVSTLDLVGRQLAGAEAAEVRRCLRASLLHWAERGVHGVWFEVALQHSAWIPWLVEEGFVFHHAQGDQAVLTKWLPKDKPNTLPLYPFTTVGVGGVVVNAQGEVLLMKERRGHYLGWKFPGGLADPGEFLPTAVEREVFEETGVKATFQSVLLWRHTNKAFYRNTCDFYIVCYMKPVDEDDIKVTPCEREAAAAQWMSRDAINNLPSTEIHQFHHKILEQLDKHIASGRKGCHLERQEICVGNYKRTWDLYVTD